MRDHEKYELCLEALKDYVSVAGFTDVVIGLSGGIDSALVATMCVDAFGASRVHGVLLPGPYSSSHSIEDALALSSNLRIETETISIIEPYEAFEKALQGTFSQEFTLGGLAAENTQARCRMVCLMALSNAHSWLMINTGNKSEAMMGYSTLYGDTAGAFAPLGGLYKTDVYALAHMRNEQAVREGLVAPIPEGSLTKPPSAELSPNQEDERVMGIAYAELDCILIALVEKGLSKETVAAEGFSLDEIERIQAVIKATAFKRALEPPFPQAKFY